MANTRNTKTARHAIRRTKATHDHATSTASVVPIGTPAGVTPLMSTEAVVNEIYNGQKSRWWVTHNFAPESKIPQGRDCFWPRDEAWAWVMAQRGRMRGDEQRRPARRAKTKA